MNPFDMAMVALASGAIAALYVSWRASRRLKRLADAVDAFARGGCTEPLHVAGADAGGDEIDRLAAHVEQMSARIGKQFAEIERGVDRRRELLANVSHDLRTPLASMQGYLELLLLRHGSLPPAEERNYLETAVRHGERLGRLVGDLFELTRLEAAEALPQPEAFSLAELAQDVAQKFALDARARKVDLRAAGGEGSAAIRAQADIGMVERVLENLVDNALRHTPPGGSVTIEFGGDAQRARMAVRDSGCGIPPAELAGIFDRYDRADRSVPGAQGGLGLAIAQRIVRLHGGELSVASIAGAGSCFAFDLPLAAPRPAAPVDRCTERMSS
ncbi:HAMP domain-containing sensor histidine kinase [Variovorax sp. LjRoot290]|uniref:sensor histidine kinase n=1 Tax=Variovorax sp. LjRoot290 TaxID=3342316 RepID=UPI003ECD1210